MATSLGKTNRRKESLQKMVIIKKKSYRTERWNRYGELLTIHFACTNVNNQLREYRARTWKGYNV